ncbi:MAG TPA: type ISP restriction/modification enzyme [Thermoanaerobaculia bacterium]|nr:type ISP restriction/modification enzyme [Thermoanaerobaculia bacterium]
MALRPRPTRNLSSAPASGSDPLAAYRERVEEEGRRGDAREETFYPFLGALLEALAVRLGRPGVRAIVIPRKTEECLLDLQIRDSEHGIVGYVEAKRPGTNLDRAEGSEQVERYRKTFPNLLLTDFCEIRLYRRGAREGAVRIDAPDGEERLLALVGDFLAFRAPRPPDAAALAVALAGRARVLAARIAARLEREQRGGEVSRLSGFYQAFRQYLLSKLDIPQFADLYAQTIAYGLLAARWAGLRESFDRAQAFEEIPLSSGILRDVFRYISVGPMPAEVGWIVDDLVDLLRQSAFPDFGRSRAANRLPLRGTDPILHFYETFLRSYDPDLRKRRGVFYTPLPVVSYIVRSVDLLLRRLGRPLGLADPGVRLLDPAAGTMTFVVEACRIAAQTWRQERGEAAVAALVREHLLPHFFGFELMMAPYAIGHLQMSVSLGALGHRPADGERVQLYLTDALHREQTAQTPLPYVDALAHESQEADRIKQDERISVVIGNPPWAGHSANPDATYNELLQGYRLADGRSDEGYFRVDGEPLGERNPKWLRDDYVKFLRFAQWKIDQNGEGIVGFVTNHGWLDGATFRGMRRSLLRTFDEVYVLDLHGNRRRREGRPDGSADANVFGIEQGMAIVLLVKRPGLERRVLRADLQGGRMQKLRWLAGRDVESTDWTEVEPQGPAYFFVRGDAGVEAEYRRGLPLPQIFDLFSAGLITGRDALVTDVDRERLHRRVRDFRGELMLREAGGCPGVDLAAWKLSRERLRRAREDTAWEERLTTFLVRPFDIRYLFAADYVLERPREAVLRHLRRGGNLALIVPRQHKEEAGALVTDQLAGHKAVSAHDVNYVFPLWREPAGALAGERASNLTPQVRRLLGDLYGEEPAPGKVLAYVYAVLWAPTYRERYADLLRRDFPRIPFPPDREVFDRLATLGAELIELHLLRDPRLADSPVRFLGDGDRPLAAGRRARIYRPEERRVLLDGEALCFEGIEVPVWYFRIGGYQVLDRWLAARAGRRLGLEEIETFRKIVAALERTREVERRIGEVLIF